MDSYGSSTKTIKIREYVYNKLRGTDIFLNHSEFGVNLRDSYPSIESASASGPKWSYQEGTRWVVYDLSDQDGVERAFQSYSKGSGSRTASFTFRGNRYTLDFSTKTQCNDRTRFKRRIRRLEPNSSDQVELSITGSNENIESFQKMMIEYYLMFMSKQEIETNISRLIVSLPGVFDLINKDLKPYGCQLHNVITENKMWLVGFGDLFHEAQAVIMNHIG
eukprot:CAMPEP_0114989182 /NCGR_PEP_ID=MMETSP0216-20121206/10048_1 /TAXON_ID=223996 /ORGANISM="Protocruzia adherens, Strain Boccale" /LENGTH=219 /DNA_ID=CAMNT_0002352117 /DNA_START=44 /DNA_END=703 /DNA_ORIENTATION=+